MGTAAARSASLLSLGALAALNASLASAQDCETFIRGDANSDGTLNIADPVSTLGFLFLGTSLECEDAADANDTGELDVTDPVHVLNFLFLGGSPPAPPGPVSCGNDPTPDLLSCSIPACAGEPVRFDESGFIRFRYSIHPGLGFCPDPGEVLEATIERVDGGTYRFEHSVIEEGSPGDPGCLPETVSMPCAVAVSRPSRVLTAGEAEGVRAAFSEVRIHLEADPICNCIAFDPCLITRFSWDGADASDFLCGPPFLEGDDARAIRKLVESLSTAP